MSKETLEPEPDPNLQSVDVSAFGPVNYASLQTGADELALKSLRNAEPFGVNLSVKIPEAPGMVNGEYTTTPTSTNFSEKLDQTADAPGSG